MKNLKTIAIAVLMATSTLATAQTKQVDAAKSKVEWIGKKVTGQHNGTINLKSGALVFEKKKLKGGTFVVDMTTINTTDLKPGKGKEDLDGHLKADDFFGTDNFPTAKLDFKLISDNGDNTYNVAANLTIKEVTAPVNFKMTVNGNVATTTLKIDRTKYGIKYGSGSFFDNLGDKTINDEFQLDVTLQY